MSVQVDNDGYETGPSASDQVGDIANEPDEEKEERDGFSIAITVVLNELGDLHAVAISIGLLFVSRDGLIAISRPV